MQTCGNWSEKSEVARLEILNADLRKRLDIAEKRLKIALRGLDDIEYKDSGYPCACGGIASGIKAEIEEVK